MNITSILTVFLVRIKLFATSYLFSSILDICLLPAERTVYQTRWVGKMWQKLEIKQMELCLFVCLFVGVCIWGQGKDFLLPSSVRTHISAHKRPQPWPYLCPYLRLSLEAVWALDKLLFAARGEVSREADILREQKHLISTLRELGCQPGGCNSVHCVTLRDCFVAEKETCHGWCGWR